MLNICLVANSYVVCRTKINFQYYGKKWSLNDIDILAWVATMYFTAHNYVVSFQSQNFSQTFHNLYMYNKELTSPA